MSVKFIKIRFNTNNPTDQKVLDALEGVEKQNGFIKNAILYYADKGTDDLAKRIAEQIFEKLKDLPLTAVSIPETNESTPDITDFSESADIADAFLDSL